MEAFSKSELSGRDLDEMCWGPANIQGRSCRTKGTIEAEFLTHALTPSRRAVQSAFAT